MSSPAHRAWTERLRQCGGNRHAIVKAEMLVMRGLLVEFLDKAKTAGLLEPWPVSRTPEDICDDVRACLTDLDGDLALLPAAFEEQERALADCAAATLADARRDDMLTSEAA